MAAQEVAQSVPCMTSKELWAEVCSSFRPEPYYVYFVGSENGLVKIGFAGDLDYRFSKLVCGSPVPLTMLAITPGGRPKEREYHQRFKQWRRHGEWFELSDEIKEEIERLAA